MSDILTYGILITPSNPSWNSSNWMCITRFICLQLFSQWPRTISISSFIVVRPLNPAMLCGTIATYNTGKTTTPSTCALSHCITDIRSVKCTPISFHIRQYITCTIRKRPQLLLCSFKEVTDINWYMGGWVTLNIEWQLIIDLTSTGTGAGK